LDKELKEKMATARYILTSQFTSSEREQLLAWAAVHNWSVARALREAVAVAVKAEAQKREEVLA
jgi:hypothetical protein